MNEFYDPAGLASEVRKKVARDGQRKYYRTSRPGRWYGGIATADCVGCNLKCVFCWSHKPRENPETVGHFHTAEDIYMSLTRCADRSGYRLLRVSGNEPTICKEHILELLKLIEGTEYYFILETNGTLLDAGFAADLRGFRNLRVRVSLKGTTGHEFSRLTGADPSSFDLQLDAIDNLVSHGVSCSVAVMLSFSPRANLLRLRDRIARIDREVAASLEEEYVLLYPHVTRKLRQAGLKPLLAFGVRS